MITDSDCWVLFSVGFDKKGSDLLTILANGDRINHAIFGRDELENGLNTLLHNGLLRRGGEGVFAREKDHVMERENERFFATLRARLFYKRDRKFFEGSIEEWLRFSGILAAIPCEDSTVKEYELSEEEYRAAVRAYLKSSGISIG